MGLATVAESRCFEGRQLRFRHRAETVSCDMHFSVYLPPLAERERVPLLYWLSGLTCTDENVVIKSGFQRAAARCGIAVVAPDTSPRGDGVPDDPDGAYDFGLGAGFYVNATQPPWSTHYRMYDYVTQELPALIEAEFPVDPSRRGIFGHSMGGHGALTVALKNRDRFRAVSAFAPICAPSRCPWGQKALGHYLGDDRSAWREYDASALIEDGAPVLPMRVDQGEADDFLSEQLKPELLVAACSARTYPLELHRHGGYDHGYHFIATFIDEHFGFHAAQFAA
jgi:S-formylglutathione hydrolase